MSDGQGCVVPILTGVCGGESAGNSTRFGGAICDAHAALEQDWLAYHARFPAEPERPMHHRLEEVERLYGDHSLLALGYALETHIQGVLKDEGLVLARNVEHEPSTIGYDDKTEVLDHYLMIVETGSPWGERLTRRLLGRMFGIDEQALNDEKEAMLEALRRSQERS